MAVAPTRFRVSTLGGAGGYGGNPGSASGTTEGGLGVEVTGAGKAGRGAGSGNAAGSTVGTGGNYAGSGANTGGSGADSGGTGANVEGSAGTGVSTKGSSGGRVLSAPLSEELPQTGLVKNSGNYRSVTERAELGNIIDEAIKQGYAAFDTETTGLNIMTDQLVGFSLSLKTGEAVYVPVKGPAPELGEIAHPLMADKDAMAELLRLFFRQISAGHNSQRQIRLPDTQTTRAVRQSRPKKTLMPVFLTQ